MKPKTLIESNAFYHKIAINPNFGEPVRVAIDESGMLTVYKLDATGQLSGLVAQITLSDLWILDGAEAALLLTSGDISHRISFYPRVSPIQALILSPVLRAAFSPRFKAVLPVYDEFRRTILRFGVRVQKHRVLGPIIIGTLLAVGALAALMFIMPRLQAQ